VKDKINRYPQVPRTKQRLVLTETPPPHNREQLLQFDHSVQKYTGNLGGLAGRIGRNGAGLPGNRDSCLAPAALPRLIGSSRRPSEPLDSLVTTSALFSSGNEFTETHWSHRITCTTLCRWNYTSPKCYSLRLLKYSCVVLGVGCFYQRTEYTCLRLLLVAISYYHVLKCRKTERTQARSRYKEWTFCQDWQL